MNRRLIALLLAGLFAAAGCGGQKATGVASIDPRIIGTWNLTEGDYPLTNEYRADGTMVQHLMRGKTEPVPFRIEGNQLIYVQRQDDGRITEQKTQFELSGDTLTFIYSPEVRMVFVRQR